MPKVGQRSSRAALSYSAPSRNVKAMPPRRSRRGRHFPPMLVLVGHALRGVPVLLSLAGAIRPERSERGSATNPAPSCASERMSSSDEQALFRNAARPYTAVFRAGKISTQLPKSPPESRSTETGFLTAAEHMTSAVTDELEGEPC